MSPTNASITSWSVTRPCTSPNFVHHERRRFAVFPEELHEHHHRDRIGYVQRREELSLDVETFSGDRVLTHRVCNS